jgi:signal transduction histidine kinase
MLRRLRIRGKLLLAVLLPIAALTAFAGLAITTFRTVQVNGAEYRRIALIESMQADLTPTQDYVLVAYAAAQRILLQADKKGPVSEIDVRDRKLAVQMIDEAERSFRKRRSKWLGKDVAAGVDVSAIDEPYKAGIAFFTALNDDFMPQIRRGDVQTATQMNTALLSSRFADYRDAADDARRQLDVRKRRIESSVATLINRRFWMLTLGALAAVMLAATIGYAVARSISRRVIHLTDFATKSANHDLPEAIASAQKSGSTTAPMVTAVRVDSSDELGELANAFNAMQDTAVGLATEQALARKVMAENLVHIGRRNQGLINRTLGFISDLERSEQDPDVLANLFRLDHLTTRMRRGAESLLVLAGSDPVSNKRTSEEIADVVRGALSEIEAYDRVELASLEPVKVAPQAVRPLAHLLAELLENAASFSPPTTKVTVIGRQTRAGYHLAIIDRGLGMKLDALAAANKTLAGGNEFLTTPTKMLGQRVVAQLSSRLDIRVRLSLNEPGEGITANVLIPGELVEDLTESVEQFSPVDRDSRPNADRTNADRTFHDRTFHDRTFHDRYDERYDNANGPSTLHDALRSTDELTVPTDWIAEAATDAPLRPTSILKGPPSAPSTEPPSGFVVFAPPTGPTQLPPSVVAPLTRRVRGAQMPDLGPQRTTEPTTRPASSFPPPTPPSPHTGLSAFQAGVQRASDQGAPS